MNGIKVCGSKRSHRLFISLISVIVLFLQSCGVSDGGSSGGYQLAGGGVGGSGYSSGTVSSFGSIYSNDIHFDTRNAEIIVEGQLAGRGDAAAQEHLNLGQIVRIEGDIHDDDTGVAQRIYYDKTIEGPITDVEILDPYTRRITVLGQEIIADSQTEYVNIDLYSLMTDDDKVLEISGFFSDDGLLNADYIAMKDRAETVTVTGTVQGLDTSSQVFRIGELDIDYGMVMTPMPIFTDGEKVRVKGTIDSGGTLEANALTAWEPLGSRLEAEIIKIEGIVHWIDIESCREIVVDGVLVQIDDNTQYQGIEDAAELIAGMEVMVYGTLTEGVVHADKIDIKYNTVRTHGNVTALDRAERTFTINNQLIRINSITLIDGHGGGMHFDDIAEGDYVVVYGWLRTDHSITAPMVMVYPNMAYPYCDYWGYK